MLSSQALGETVLITVRKIGWALAAGDEAGSLQQCAGIAGALVNGRVIVLDGCAYDVARAETGAVA